MMLTSEERAVINRQNAEKSTGPKTTEGKEISRRNALDHGMTAEELTLDNDDPADVQAEAEGWFASVEPENHQEAQLANFAAAASVRLQRALKKEASVISKQRSCAFAKYLREQDLKLVQAKRIFRKDPVVAVIELKNFGKGVDWLLDQWKHLVHSLDEKGYWSTLEIIKDAAKLLGYNPEVLAYEDFEGYEFVLSAICLIPGYEEDTILRNYMSTQMLLRYEAREGRDACYLPDVAIEHVRLVVNHEIGFLKRLKVEFDEEHQHDIDTLHNESLVPLDTPQNRLMLRYMKEAESSLIRNVKTLAKLQSDRKKETANEVRKAAPPESRNEAIFKATATTDQVHVGSYIDLKNRRYEVLDAGDGAIYMAECPSETPEKPKSQYVWNQDGERVPYTGA